MKKETLDYGAVVFTKGEYKQPLRNQGFHFICFPFKFFRPFILFFEFSELTS